MSWDYECSKKKAKEVVPIIFISYLSIGDRADGIRTLA
jgi:hypothetical protein